MLSDLEKWLADPFPPQIVKWRIGPRNQEKTKGQPLCYVDARMVMQRLDDVVGQDNWQDKYAETPKRIICSLGIFNGDTWIWKSDGAGDTSMEGEKGGLSDAFKRAAVKFGIGRYLYSVHVPWIDLKEGGYMPDNWNGQEYLKAHKPTAWITHMNAVKENWDSIVSIKEHTREGRDSAAWEELSELGEAVVYALNMAATKGAIWTVEDTKSIARGKADDFDADAGVYRSIADRKSNA